MYRRYYSYNDMPTIQKSSEKPKETKHTPPQKQEASIVESLKANLQTDDIILLAVIFILLYDNCDDKLLLLALAFIFFNS